MCTFEEPSNQQLSALRYVLLYLLHISLGLKSHLRVFTFRSTAALKIVFWVTLIDPDNELRFSG